MDPFIIKSDTFPMLEYSQVGCLAAGPGVNYQFWADDARARGQKILVTPQGLEFYETNKKKGKE